jgi:hypothetical protein
MDNKPIKILKTEEAPLSCFGFNPKYTMMVTGHEQLVSDKRVPSYDNTYNDLLFPSAR